MRKFGWKPVHLQTGVKIENKNKKERRETRQIQKLLYLAPVNIVHSRVCPPRIRVTLSRIVISGWWGRLPVRIAIHSGGWSSWWRCKVAILVWVTPAVSLVVLWGVSRIVLVLRIRRRSPVGGPVSWGVIVLICVFDVQSSSVKLGPVESRDRRIGGLLRSVLDISHPAVLARGRRKHFD
jgi:hypothetical protein